MELCLNKVHSFLHRTEVSMFRKLDRKATVCLLRTQCARCTREGLTCLRGSQLVEGTCFSLGHVHGEVEELVKGCHHIDCLMLTPRAGKGDDRFLFLAGNIYFLR